MIEKPSLPIRLSATDTWSLSDMPASISSATWNLVFDGSAAVPGVRELVRFFRLRAASAERPVAMALALPSMVF